MECFKGLEDFIFGEQLFLLFVFNVDVSFVFGIVFGVKVGLLVMEESIVDWDFWQFVVYEGFVVVVRISVEELNCVIVNGIFNVI